MKSFKRLISTIITACLLVSLLPAQFALAAGEEANIGDYVDYGDFNSIDAEYKGHIWNLQDVTDDMKTESDYEGVKYYKLTVYLRNSKGTSYISGIKYKFGDIDLLPPGESDPDMAYVYDDSVDPDSGDMAGAAALPEVGLIQTGMTTQSSYVNKAINTNTYPFSLSEMNTTHVDGEYYKLYTAVNIGVIANTYRSRWSTPQGAKYEEGVGGEFTYTTPTNVNCPLFSYYFRLKEGKTLDVQTIYPTYNDLDGAYGGAVKYAGESDSQIYDNSGVLLTGEFPVPTVADQIVKFNGVFESNGTTPISGATVKIYSDEAKATQITGSPFTTDSQGKINDLTLPANSKYYYTVSKNEYADATGSFEVKAVQKTVDAIKLTKAEAVTYSVTFTVKDKDNGNVLQGATVYVDNAAISGTTGANGQLSGEFTAGEKHVKASLTGYQTETGNGTKTFKPSQEPSVTVELVPERVNIPITAPTVGGQPVEDAKVTVTKLDNNKTDEWGTQGSHKEYTDDQIDNINVPKNGEYSVVISAPGYTQKTVYVKTSADGNTTEFYNDRDFTDKIEGTPDTSIKKLEDAFYTVDIQENSGTYTASVKLSNINAVNGTFGLRYDKDLFDFNAEGNGFSLTGDGIELADFLSEGAILGPVTKSSDSDAVGYHVFSWYAATGSFDTTSGAKDIANYTFTLKANKSANDIRPDSITVMPFDKTAFGKEITDDYVSKNSTYENAYNDGMINYWRYADADNNASGLSDGESLKTGRISDEYALLNGFYQVMPWDSVTFDGNEYGEAYYHDVRTIITGLEAKKAAITFVVTGEDDKPVNEAEITLYDNSGNAVGTIKTDASGLAVYDVDTTAGDVTYTYTVNAPGYWDYPTKDTDDHTVTVRKNDTPEIVNEYVKMEEKIYHVPVLKYDDDKDPHDSVEAEKASLSGDKYAYNNRDFHFNVKPETNWKFENPATLTVIVNVPVQNADDGEYAGYHFVPTECTATFNRAANAYELKKEDIKGIAKTNTPDEIGFKSDDILVLIPNDKLTPSDDKFTVTALAGTNGKVEYAGDTVEGGVTVTKDDSSVVISNITPKSSTDNITFTANDGYKVEKVIVNGVQIHNYDDEKTFSYKFENITMDNTIAVTFWDGRTPSTDKVITLVVGDKGTAKVTAPKTEDVTNTRKAYIVTDETALTFTTDPTKTPNADGYVLDTVEKEVEGTGTKTPVEPSDNTYTVTPEAGKNVIVYVTFKDKDAEKTFNVFVKAYVAEGKGTINPVGVLTYNKFDSPTFELLAQENDYKVVGVKLDDADGTKTVQYPERKQTNTYTIESIEKDTEIGAIFAETAYKLAGILDYSQKKNVTTEPVRTAATVVCVRESDGMKVYSTDVEKNRTNANFTVELAPGDWTIKVSKPGYLDYIINNIKVEASDDVHYLGAAAGETAAKPIVLVVGDTSGKGKMVTLADVGILTNGLTTGASAAMHAKADIDDDGTTKVEDMTYIKSNYGKRYVKETYEQFKAN